jgi:hypothetical protein
MLTKFHLETKESAQHDVVLRPDSSIEVEITHSLASGLANTGGTFELQLFRRNDISSEWEQVGTDTIGIGARARSVFDSLDRGREYTVGVFYKGYGDAIDSELSVDGNIIVH